MTHTTSRKELTDHLTSMGASDALIAIATRASGPARHRARVQATLAAVDAAVATTEGGIAPALLSAWHIASDINGIGGPAGLGGEGRKTERADWARGLGSGRWQAQDGAAYAAAACDAFWSLTRQTVTITIANQAVVLSTPTHPPITLLQSDEVPGVRSAVLLLGLALRQLGVWSPGDDHPVLRWFDVQGDDEALVALASRCAAVLQPAPASSDDSEAGQW